MPTVSHCVSCLASLSLISISYAYVYKYKFMYGMYWDKNKIRIWIWIFLTKFYFRGKIWQQKWAKILLKRCFSLERAHLYYGIFEKPLVMQKHAGTPPHPPSDSAHKVSYKWVGKRNSPCNEKEDFDSKWSGSPVGLLFTDDVYPW